MTIRHLLGEQGLSTLRQVKNSVFICRCRASAEWDSAEGGQSELHCPAGSYKPCTVCARSRARCSVGTCTCDMTRLVIHGRQTGWASEGASRAVLAPRANAPVSLVTLKVPKPQGHPALCLSPTRGLAGSPTLHFTSQKPSRPHVTCSTRTLSQATVHPHT